MEYIENRTYDQISIGESASVTRTITEADITIFGILSGDQNPAHFDQEYAEGSMFKRRIAHGMISGALISAVLGMQLPGPGTIFISQTVRFRRPVYIGDTITVTITVTEKNDAKQRLIFDCQCVNQDGEVTTVGTAEVLAPTEPIRRPLAPLPAIQLV
ncbi:MAG: hypothetical protein HC911_14115 [Chloroflexaceae bacterium]|nr:hypothetical protein [Chloroflexaceae bacterium]